MHTLIKGALAALALGTTAPAFAATTVSFDLTGNDSAVTGSMTNSKTFSSTVAGTTYKLQASAWELDGNGALSQAHLGDYSSGLGSTNKDDHDGEWNEHEIDNLHGADFVMLQFDHAVTLTSATLNPFNLMYFLPNDTDATYSHATSAAAWNSTPALSSSLMAALAGNVAGVAGNGNAGSVSINPNGASGNVWIIGADMLGIDCNYDGFKLSGVTVRENPTPAVPEPATWATMLAGFGAVGSAMRRRSSRRSVQAV